MSASSKLKCGTIAMVTASALTLMLAPAAASGHDHTADSAVNGTSGALGLSLGSGGTYQRATLAYQTPAFGRVSWRAGSLDALAEFSLSYWRASGSRRPDDVWQLGATPFVRWWAGERLFIEVGLGVNAFSRTRFANRRISTAIQFGEHIGVGYQFSGGGRAALRFSHYSNASIKRPNAGLDVLQLHYAQPF